jgi:hypothetical protein
MYRRKISKADYEALSDEAKKLYKLGDGDNYVLNVEVSADDDPAELRRARDREKQTAKDEKERADRLQTQLATITDTDARRAGDVDKLEKAWQKKLDEALAAKDAIIASKDKFISTTLVESKAQIIATNIAGENADVVLPHIVKRLKADLTGEEPLTRVMDAKGNVSALTLEELEKEFVANPKFSAIVIGSKASGGAAGGNKNQKRSGAASEKKFSELNDAERTEWYQRDPEGFTKAAEEANRARF